jgi:predicted metal-dependent hydrolase
MLKKITRNEKQQEFSEKLREDIKQFIANNPMHEMQFLVAQLSFMSGAVAKTICDNYRIEKSDIKNVADKNWEISFDAQDHH